MASSGAASSRDFGTPAIFVIYCISLLLLPLLHLKRLAPKHRLTRWMRVESRRIKPNGGIGSNALFFPEERSCKIDLPACLKFVIITENGSTTDFHRAWFSRVLFEARRSELHLAPERSLRPHAPTQTAQAHHMRVHALLCHSCTMLKSSSIPFLSFEIWQSCVTTSSAQCANTKGGASFSLSD